MEHICSNCKHENNERNNICSPCYTCLNNPIDNRLDWFESREETELERFMREERL